MFSFGIKRKAEDLNRLREILTVVFEAGGEVLVEKIKLKYLIPFSCRIKCFFKQHKHSQHLLQMKNDKVMSPEMLCDVLEKLGPTFIKLGQVLSLRADLVGEDISNQLSKLQNDASSFSYKEVRSIIKAELGKSPEEIFESFEKKPVAAASLAQVHKARLKNGAEVAVKVQRPEIRKTIEQDIHILFYLAHLIEKHVPELLPYQPVRVVKEFADCTLRELDFKIEGRNADRFAATFKENKHVHIPEIYWKHTTEKVLTMEFLHGLKADNLKGMKKIKINTKALAQYGVDALLQQFLIDGFFHADPHPGNFFAMKGDILCLHDFGMVGYLNQVQCTELVSCFVAFVDKDTEAFVKHMTHLAITSNKSDVAGFQREVADILSEFFYSANQPSIAWAFFRIMNRGARHDMAFPADLALFGKAIITTEAMGLKLYPQFDFNKELKPFVEKALRHYLDPRKTMKSLRTDIFDYLEMLKTLPEKTQGLLQKIEDGKLSIKFDAAELLEFKEEFDRQNDVRVLGLVTVGVFLATAIFFYADGKNTAGNFSLSGIGLTASAILLVLLILKLRKKPEARS